MNEPDAKKFWLVYGLLPLILFAIAVVFFETTPTDLAVSDLFYDAVGHRWPLRDVWWTEGLIHRAGRKMVLFVALTALAAWALSFRIEKLHRWRRAVLFLCLSITLGTGAVSVAKAATNRHCPWDLERYGGTVPYMKLFEGEPSGCGRGVCFPAGHASAGFSLMPAYFIFYRTDRRRARVVLAAGAALGLVFGLGQVARGAHFLSHNLWTAVLCWYIGLAIYVVVFRRRILPENRL